MMSDEERRDDVYVRHQPEYRSEKFTSFLNKLDDRCSKKQTSHSRYKRTMGTPQKKSPPTSAPKWMLKMQVADEDKDDDKDEDSASHESDSELSSASSEL